MNRREFLGAVGTSASMRLAGTREEALPVGDDIYLDLVKAVERTAEESLPRQQADGGLRDEHEIPQPGATAGFLSSLAALFLAPESRYHRSADLLERMQRAAAYLLRVQHGDGTIDLPTTNFGSPPDTAFVLEPLCAAVEVLRARKYGETRDLGTTLETFIQRAASALTMGGIHTPNHRWVVVSALARCHHLFPDPRYLTRLEQWLAEGIDLDEEGQFTERSTGIYNAVTDRALLTTGRMLDRPALFEPVRKNLETMIYFLHPNGEAATDISRRQDRFQPATLRSYYLAYRFLARHDGNGRFATVAGDIESIYLHQLSGELIYFMEITELRHGLPPREPLPANYEKFFPASEFAHIRRGGRSATVLGGDSRFFSFRHDGAVVEGVRLASAFFGKGQFSAPLSRRGSGYRLEQELEGYYLQPLDPQDRRPDGNWEAMPNSRRAHSNICHLRSVVDLRETEDGFELSLDIRGTDRVPLALEITLRPGGELTGDGLVAVPSVPNAYFLGDGFASYEVAGRRLRVGPGFRRHAWTQLRGAEPRLEGVTLYLTEFTPLNKTLQFSAS
ncbi:MAG TPA: hypothetical protein VKO18_02780 [Terriglobia bacterium]|nr:hypothetical protein [Terriglobia bacterium]